MADTKARLENIASSPGGITDPFDSVYKIVFLLTMRTVGCNEIANDPTLLAKALSFFEIIQQSGTPAGVIFPWLPTPAKLKRTYAGGNLYMIFQRIVNERKRTGKREDDALQFMIDHGDDVRNIIGVSTEAVTAWGWLLTEECSSSSTLSLPAKSTAESMPLGFFPIWPITPSGWLEHAKRLQLLPKNTTQSRNLH
jgi:hypothetical protein